MPTEQNEFEASFKKMREKLRPLPEIPDNRGPLVYELTREASLNGIDPTFKDLPGGGRKPDGA